jgi:hypothetical protein
MIPQDIPATSQGVTPTWRRNKKRRAALAGAARREPINPGSSCHAKGGPRWTVQISPSVDDVDGVQCLGGSVMEILQVGDRVVVDQTRC